MQQYRSFLKGLLTLTIIFILCGAVVGYKISKPEAAMVSGSTKKMVTPVGQTVGIYINTDGILVVDTSEVTDLNGRTKAPAKNKLLPGDYITALNGEELSTKKQLVDKITNCNGDTLVFTVLRNHKEIEVKIEPVETDIKVYKVGIWVRDDLQGLGTVTYVEGNHFMALGHSITDSDTGQSLNVSGGAIYYADIFGIEKGKEGCPGEIEGMISYQKDNVVGQISDNEIYGIYGTVTGDYLEEVSGNKAIEVCNMEDVTLGKAYIQSFVSGEKQLYEIEITDIHKNENGDPQMEIVVTDHNLIALTGGIVQGMSGSPIIQNGKLVGAVTHVFVENPTRGYGIFIDNMLENQENMTKEGNLN